MNWYSIDQLLKTRIAKYPEDPDKILLKVVEELGEVVECVLKGWSDKLPEEMADVQICLMLLAKYKGVDLLDEAWKKAQIVSKRQGTVVDGIFVKEADKTT